MIRSLQDILVVSDMDGTLLTDDKQLMASTLESIRLFTSLGGRFTVATGRSVESVSRYAELVPLLSPAILTGGTVIYDYEQNRSLKSATLPKLIAKNALQDVLGRFPKAGTMVFAANTQIFQVQASPYAQVLFDQESVGFHVRPLEELPPDWNKVLFAAEPEKINEIEEYVRGRPYPGVYFIHTGPIFFEIMPQGVSKGSTLSELCALLDVSLENTIVIGDYYNDLEMMDVAGYSVAMRNAPADVSFEADEICQSNNEGGVGQYLYELVKRYG
ncbi:Cof-type HAD-IIB family hydrolase [Ruminococcaceae bacterium OttesenSCG-928-I18]|nr:Cof-type HAD-IIB family hydrolase [Ruminococcaceae bacterium OttesenSCG-928-I18]